MTRKAVVVLSSVDDRPLSESQLVLVSAIARTVSSPGNKPPYLSEPVYARITLRTRASVHLELLSMTADGRVAARPQVEHRPGTVTFEIPAAGGTHWYVLGRAAELPRRVAGLRPNSRLLRNDGHGCVR